MYTPPTESPEPFRRAPIPPELLEWARQTFDAQEFLEGVREIAATGGANLRVINSGGRRPGAQVVSTESEPPQLYQVNLSGRVYDRVLELAAVARERGDGAAVLEALREFYRRLQVYPQFGDPLVDLREEAGQIRIGIVPPLAMRYGVLEERRQVFVAALPVLLPMSPAPDSASLHRNNEGSLEPPVTRFHVP